MWRTCRSNHVTIRNYLTSSQQATGSSFTGGTAVPAITRLSMDHNTTGSDSNIVQIGDFARDVPFTSTQPEFIDISEEPTGHSTPASTPRTPGHQLAIPSSS